MKLFCSKCGEPLKAFIINDDLEDMMLHVDPCIPCGKEAAFPKVDKHNLWALAEDYCLRIEYVTKDNDLRIFRHCYVMPMRNQYDNKHVWIVDLSRDDRGRMLSLLPEGIAEAKIVRERIKRETPK